MGTKLFFVIISVLTTTVNCEYKVTNTSENLDVGKQFAHTTVTHRRRPWHEPVGNTDHKNDMTVLKNASILLPNHIQELSFHECNRDNRSSAFHNHTETFRRKLRTNENAQLMSMVSNMTVLVSEITNKTDVDKKFVHENLDLEMFSKNNNNMIGSGKKLNKSSHFQKTVKETPACVLAKLLVNSKKNNTKCATFTFNKDVRESKRKADIKNFEIIDQSGDINNTENATDSSEVLKQRFKNFTNTTIYEITSIDNKLPTLDQFSNEELSKNEHIFRTEADKDDKQFVSSAEQPTFQLQSGNSVPFSEALTKKSRRKISGHAPSNDSGGKLDTRSASEMHPPPMAAMQQDGKEQQEDEASDKLISVPVLKFPEVPPGDSFHIQELGLSEGLFVFSYISDFLSWIQPYDFPVELLRDALWNRVSVVDLITQSLQVEVGFIVCLTVGILLALGVPCILITHACCRFLGSSNRNSSWNEDSPNETTDNCAVNCRRCTLVFIMQLILLLLVAGIVSMFVTNEQMSRAVDQTPSVVHTALNDVTTFLRNSHQQLRFVITKSLDQSVDATNTDLDNVEELLGRPIQDELAMETGVDVALDALFDVSAEARVISGKVEALLASCAETREMIVESRERLADLRMQVDRFRQQCPSRFRPLCDTVDSSGLDVVLRLEMLMSDSRLAQIMDLRDGNLSLVTQHARGEFQFIPLRIEKETRDARNGVKRQLSQQRETLYDSIWSLEVLTRDISYKIENVRNQALEIVRGMSIIEQWRWFTGLGAAVSVLVVWLLLLSGLSCGCCGSEERAAPTLLASVVLMCIISVALWGIALSTLLVGGHGEVFVCRPLYDEPEFTALTRLVDRPGVLFQRGGGFFSNLLYGNSTLDVPLRDVLLKCQQNGSTYSAFKLKQIFDVDAASKHERWDSLHAELRRLHVNLTNLQLLTPELQQHLQALLYATTVNLTSYRTQMTGQMTGKDLSSFADQMMSVANQISERTTLSRLDALTSTTRLLVTSHIQPLEQRKEDLVYQLTALEMQMIPLQRQVNQSLSHFKTIQYFINNQGSNIAYQKSEDYTDRLVSYVDQYRSHVLNTTQNYVAPCRPVWNLYHAMRLLFCRHIMDPLNGFWFATVWCLVLFLAATPTCLRLVDHYRQLKQSNSLVHSRSSESPSETLMISEQGPPWSTPGAPEPDGW